MSGPYHGNLKAPFVPVAVSDLDIAFPAKYEHLMPAMDDIPEEFRRGRTPWNDLFSQWFFNGLDARVLAAKPDINRTLALRHLKAFMGSFGPAHEHKEASAAFLMSLWFEPITTERPGAARSAESA